MNKVVSDEKAAGPVLHRPRRLSQYLVALFDDHVVYLDVHIVLIATARP